MLLGFSTGCLYKTHDSLAKETFDIFRKIGANAIEIMSHEREHISRLLDIMPEDLIGFEYISVHAPSFDNHSEVEVVEILKILEKAHEKLHFNAIVIHPYETMNFDLFSQFDLPFAIENMDWRKDFGKYTDSLKDIFEKFDAPMVLDLNHCYTNDPSMRLAHEMVDEFRSRIKEIHLSGFEKLYEPLFRTNQKEIAEAIPDVNLPVIIESGLESIEEAQEEFKYVKEYLLGH